jgi:hypothetical protein
MSVPAESPWREKSKAEILRGSFAGCRPRRACSRLRPTPESAAEGGRPPSRRRRKSRMTPVVPRTPRSRSSGNIGVHGSSRLQVGNMDISRSQLRPSLPEIRKAAVAVTVAGSSTFDQYWEDGPQLAGGATCLPGTPTELRPLWKEPLQPGGRIILFRQCPSEYACDSVRAKDAPVGQTP